MKNPECPKCFRQMIREKNESEILWVCSKPKHNGTIYHLCFSCVDENKSGIFPKINNNGETCDKCNEYFCENHKETLHEHKSDECTWSDFYCDKCNPK